MRHGDERRRHRRFSCELPLQYRSFDLESGHPSRGFTKNISEGGVKFVSSKFLPIATSLDLTINTPSSPRPIRASSKVTWIRKLPMGGYYEMGLRFTQIKEDDKGIIKDLGGDE